ncbi:hypothetical protein RQP46_000142 [Phenoliferia psychrophenolica]
MLITHPAVLAALLATFASALPAGPKTFKSRAPAPDTGRIEEHNVTPAPEYAPGQTDPAAVLNGNSFNWTDIAVPQPVRGNFGTPSLIKENDALNKQNPDAYAPPETDSGTVYQGERRFYSQAVLPIAAEMAGVTMTLKPNAYRELHWHTAGEWGYMFSGSARISTVDTDSAVFIDDILKGDLWYFPSGIPHAIQAHEDGCEFLLVFDDGNFSEDNTFLLTDWIAHTPKEVVAKNFQLAVSDLSALPEKQLWIFNGTENTNTLEADAATITSPAGTNKMANSFHWSQMNATEYPGGSVKIADSTSNFPISTTIAAALVTINPGAMREMHWHPTSDEWSFFLSGQGRVTVSSGPSAARTFDFTAGDVGYITKSDGHYIENTGTEPLVLLEVLKAPTFSDIALGQWLSHTPKQIVQDHLMLSGAVIDKIFNGEKTKAVIVG